MIYLAKINEYLHSPFYTQALNMNFSILRYCKKNKYKPTLIVQYYISIYNNFNINFEIEFFIFTKDTYSFAGYTAYFAVIHLFNIPVILVTLK